MEGYSVEQYHNKPTCELGKWCHMGLNYKNMAGAKYRKVNACKDLNTSDLDGKHIITWKKCFSIEQYESYN